MRPASLTACALLLLPLAARADTLAQRLDLEGSLRGGYFSSSALQDGRKDVGAGALWLKASPELGEESTLVLEALVRKDDVTGKRASHARVREGYLQWSGGDADVRIGKQIIIWGRADRINPTDNITPRDYTWLTPEENDQRLGVLAASARYRLDRLTLTAIWLPRFVPNRLPLAAAPGLAATGERPQAAQGAFKIDQSGGAVDWSLSWFNGLDINPDARLEAGPAAPRLVLTHRRVRVLGLDAAVVAGRYGLRAEAAYTWTASAGPADVLTKKPHLYLVAGADRTFYEHLNVNLQYYRRHVAGYQDPGRIVDPLLRAVALRSAVLSNQARRDEHGISLRVADKWLHETLEAEVAGVFSLTHRSYALKPRLVYAFNDRWKGTLGADIYRGGERGFFGQLDTISAAFAEIRFSF